MSEVQLADIRAVFQLFEDKLKEASDTLDQQDQVPVMFLTTLDMEALNPARGIYGILMNGNNFSKDEKIRGNALIMKDDLLIGVASVIRFISNPNVSIENQPMIPAEYTELAVNTISGIEVYNKRPEYERKIFPVRTELIDEAKGVWKYLTTFSVPRDFIEASLTE